MISFSDFVKINLAAGFFGTIASIPFLYLFEFIRTAGHSELLHFGITDIYMAIIVPIIMALLFAFTAMLAFPLIRFLQVRNILPKII